MNRNDPLALRDRLLRGAAILLIVVMAGPEVGMGLELLAFLDIVGAELFLLCFALGFRSYAIWARDRVFASLEKVDPYFFVPSRQQILRCPGIVAHMIPWFVCLYVLLVLCEYPFVEN